MSPKPKLRHQVFTEGMGQLTELYGKELSPHALEAYWQAVKHLGNLDFKHAVRLSAQRERFFPLPAVLLDLVDGGGEARAIYALERVNFAVRSIGPHQSVDFEDRAINAAIRALGGWADVCALSSDEWRRFRSKDFLKAYRAYSSRDVPEEAGKHLIGITEHANSNAFPEYVPDVVCVGCRWKKEPELLAAVASKGAES